MTNRLTEELAARAAVTFDEAEVLDAVHRKIALRQVHRQRITTVAAGFMVVALVIGAVLFGRNSSETASAPVPGVVVSATPVEEVTPEVLASSVVVVKNRLADVSGVSVVATGDGGIVASGPAQARDRMVAAVGVVGQFAVRPVLTASSGAPGPTRLSTLPEQPAASADERVWQDAVIAAAKDNALPCRRTLAPAAPTRPLFSCNRSDGSVAVLGRSTVSGSVRAEVVEDPAGQSPRALSLTLDAAGQRAVEDYTAAHIGSPIAFMIDDQILSAPAISSPITSSSITLRSTESENQLLEYARALNRPLPAPFIVTDISETH